MDYIVKAVIFLAFLSFVYFILDYFLAMLRGYLLSISSSVIPMMCQFGILEGLKVFLSILATGFALKQIVSFLK